MVNISIPLIKSCLVDLSDFGSPENEAIKCSLYITHMIEFVIPEPAASQKLHHSCSYLQKPATNFRVLIASCNILLVRVNFKLQVVFI